MPEAVTEGLKYAGYEVKLMPGDPRRTFANIAAASSSMKGRCARSHPLSELQEAASPIQAPTALPKKGQLTLQQVAQYAAMFAVELKKRTEAGGAPADQEPAAK